MRWPWLALLFVPLAWYLCLAPLLTWRLLLQPASFFKGDWVEMDRPSGLIRSLELARFANDWNPYVHLYVGMIRARGGDRTGAAAALSRFGELGRAEETAFVNQVLVPSLRGQKPVRIVLGRQERDLLEEDDTIKLLQGAIWRGQIVLASDLVIRAEEAGWSGFRIGRLEALLHCVKGEWEAAAKRLAETARLKSGADRSAGVGLGFNGISYLLSEGPTGTATAVPVWKGRVTSLAREIDLAFFEVLYNLAELSRMTGNYRKGLRVAQILKTGFGKEIARRGLEGSLDRMLHPLNHAELIRERAKEEGVDRFLVHAIILTESHYDAEDVSPVGATGLMQLMPDTGRWIALKRRQRGFEPADLKDPGLSIEMGCWYLAQLDSQLPEGARANLTWILAAYNSGPGNVPRWYRAWKEKGGRPEDHISFPETRDYVRKVTLSYDRYKALWSESSRSSGEG